MAETTTKSLKKELVQSKDGVAYSLSSWTRADGKEYVTLTRSTATKTKRQAIPVEDFELVKGLFAQAEIA